MAYVGLRKPIVAEILESGKYGEPFAFGKAIGLNITPTYAEGGLNADDAQVEYDKEFNYAEVSLNTNTIPFEAYKRIFGHTAQEGEKNVVFNKDDQANYIGQAWVSVEKVEGVRKFIGNFLYKVKYSEPTEEYATKGDAIEYKTPTITGRALAQDDGKWKETQSFDTQEEALTWINKKFGKTE